VKGISGGEMKRLSIAAEIIHQPKIIFLDEPTTGLDSASALMVTHVLKKLASTFF
jgi:ABC-type multidrug transport system ATPase subunit